MTSTLLLGDNHDIEDIVFESEEKTKTEYETKIDDFANSMRELGTGGEILVKRQTGGGKDPMEHVGYFEPDEYTYGQLVEHLRNTYGGGLYRVYLRIGGKNKGNSLVRIAEKQKGDVKPTQTGEMGDFMSGVLGQMREMQQQILDLSRENKGGKTTMETMQEIIAMKQLLETNQPTPVAQPSLISQMRDLMAIQGEMTGLFGGNDTGNDDDGFSSLLEKATPLFEAALSNPQTRPSQREQETPQQQETSNMNFMVKQGIKRLVGYAMKNADTGSCAEMVIDNLPRKVIKEFIISPDAINKLKAIDANVEKYTAWFLELAEHIKEQMGMPSTVGDEYDDLTSGGDASIVGENDPPSSTEKTVNESQTPPDVSTNNDS